MKNKNNLILPRQVFFEPTNEFLEWAKKNLRGHMIIDCGAGVGRLSSQLKLRGLSVLAIDICDRDTTDVIVLKKDSTKFEFPTRSIAIIARPSRGDWIRDTIIHAIKSCSYVLYIGIQEHIPDDVGSLTKLHIEKVFENAGKQGETVYKIMKESKSETKTTYFLVKKMVANNIFMTSWHAMEGDKWVNFNGGWCYKSDSDLILETVSVEDIHELDWRKTDLVDNTNIAGWLDREGVFTGCNSQQHDLIADLVFNKSVDEMEKCGMVRIYDKELWACERRMSPEQRNYMLYRGFDISLDK